MKLCQTALLGLVCTAPLVGAQPTSEAEAAGGLVAIRVGRAETISHGTIEHAVILVENGHIQVVGQDLEIERGIPVLDRPEWVVVPGLIDCRSRLGMDSRGGSGSEPQILASTELYPRNWNWNGALRAGFTTLGLIPDGRGIPGQSVAVRPSGSTVEQMILRDQAYLQVYLQSSQGSKKMLRDGFAEVDEYLEKEQEAFEKWERDSERIERRNEDRERDEREPIPPYNPPAPDDDVLPFMMLREGTLKALFTITKASDWLHLLDALGEEDVAWDLNLTLRNDVDYHYVIDDIGERGTRVVTTPQITLMPGTRRDRNLPAELHNAGARLALTPLASSTSSYSSWMEDVAQIVRSGLDRDAALAAMTLVPAEVLGVEAHVGSIEAGKMANLVFLDGDPFEVGTEVQAVMLEGELTELNDEDED